MNNNPQQPGLSTLVAALGLGALPPPVYARVVPALQEGATLADMHEAARAIAEECPPTCLQGVIGALIFLANPHIDITEEKKGRING